MSENSTNQGLCNRNLQYTWVQKMCTPSEQADSLGHSKKYAHMDKKESHLNIFTLPLMFLFMFFSHFYSSFSFSNFAYLFNSSS